MEEEQSLCFLDLYASSPRLVLSTANLEILQALSVTKTNSLRATMIAPSGLMLTLIFLD